MSRCIIALLMSLLLLCCSSADAFASFDTLVTSTLECTGDSNSIYIVGNPSLYPVEYYDADEGCYHGIIPELLRSVAASEGLSFTYISSGHKDERQRMIANSQAEIASGCVIGDSSMLIGSLRTSPLICSYEVEGKRFNVVLAYAEHTSDELISAINSAIIRLSSAQLTNIAISESLSSPEGMISQFVYYTAVVGLLLILILLIQHFVNARKVRRDRYLTLNRDDLTGLASRHKFVEALNALVASAVHPIYNIFYIAFDINLANMLYGENQAEKIMQSAADIIMNDAGAELNARVSGGGFALLRSFLNPDEAIAWIGGLLEKINHNTIKDDKANRLMFRAGVYRMPAVAVSEEEALLRARQGYEEAVEKDIPYMFMDENAVKAFDQNIRLQSNVFTALNKHEFQLYIQLIVSSDGKIAGGEALSRWLHPSFGLLTPADYLALIEESNAIQETDMYIFEEACRCLEQLQNRIGNSFFLSCNFSRMSLDRSDFITNLLSIAERFSIDRGRMLLEMTENSPAQDAGFIKENIRAARDAGFKIVLDDLGEGATSFADLYGYTPDVVKLDKGMLLNAASDTGAKLLKALISFFHSLDICVVCEGVETAGQVDLLRDFHCDYLQGFFYYKAMPIIEVQHILDIADLSK